jgi:hypothetical protein
MEARPAESGLAEPLENQACFRLRSIFSPETEAVAVARPLLRKGVLEGMVAILPEAAVAAGMPTGQTTAEKAATEVQG